MNSDDEEAKLTQVPPDFPRPLHFEAVPGTQSNLLMVKYNGRFYAPGHLLAITSFLISVVREMPSIW